MPVERYVQGLVIVEELEHVGRRAGVDDAGGDELIHCLMIGGLGRVVDEAGAAAVDGAREKCHANGFLVRYTLEGTDEVGPLEVLLRRKVSEGRRGEK